MRPVSRPSGNLHVVEALVTGKVTANRIDFYVNWRSPTAPTCRTITIWNGRVAGDKMPTRWKLYYVGSDWHFHEMTGRDLFTWR